MHKLHNQLLHNHLISLTAEWRHSIDTVWTTGVERKQTCNRWEVKTSKWQIGKLIYCIKDKPPQCVHIHHTWCTFHFHFFDFIQSHVQQQQLSIMFPGWGFHIQHAVYVSFMQHKHSQTKAEIWLEGLFALAVSDHLEVIRLSDFCAKMSCHVREQTEAHLINALLHYNTHNMDI